MWHKTISLMFPSASFLLLNHISFLCIPDVLWRFKFKSDNDSTFLVWDFRLTMLQSLGMGTNLNPSRCFRFTSLGLQTVLLHTSLPWTPELAVQAHFLAFLGNMRYCPNMHASSRSLGGRGICLHHFQTISADTTQKLPQLAWSRYTYGLGVQCRGCLVCELCPKPDLPVLCPSLFHTIDI